MTEAKTAQQKAQDAEAKAIADARKQADADNRAHLEATDERRAQTHSRSGDRTETLEQAQEKGYLGEKVDPEPDAAYTHPAHTG